MRLPFQLLSLAVALLSTPSESSSTIRNPIGALSTVQNATIHTKTHRITALSDFDLTFVVRNELYVKFSLEPNHNILADDATITYLRPDGTVARKESVNRLGHKVFKGSAWVQQLGAGESAWQRVGWARALIRRDGAAPFFEGAFSVNHDSHHIQSSANYLKTRHQLDPVIDSLDEEGQEYMVLWRDSDILRSSAFQHQDLRRDVDYDVPSCLADGLSFNTDPAHPVYLGMAERSSRSYGSMDFSNLFKRQIDSTTTGNQAGVNLKSTIGDPQGCPTTHKVALVGVATDCTYTADFDSTEAVRENIISQMNTASAVWENAFNISLGLQNLTLSDASCPATPAAATEWNQPCSDSVDISARLNYFSAWRGEQGGDNSHWTLLSTCNTGSAVGLAWLGQACVGASMSVNESLTGNGQSTGQGQIVSGANVVVRTSGTDEWSIIAHETGHTFGAVHDCDDQTCADTNYVNSQQCCPYTANTCNAEGQYIMNPYTRPGINTFSPCTIGNICSAIGRNSVNTACLSDNKDVVTITGQQCGNGIVEPGEQCDCGGVESCADDPCCDPTTCMFADDAVCDDANEDCCSNCQFSTKGTVCRASTGQCDPEEVCPGNNGNCPRDKTAPDGQSCGGNGDGLECASGQCTSRDQQCKTVMGSYTKGNDTHACNSQGCTISCASPEFGYGVCYGLQQYFLDGTPCGGGGHCSNVSVLLPLLQTPNPSPRTDADYLSQGQCAGTTTGGEIKSWIDDHKAIVIGICCAIGALLLFAVLGCLRRCFTRSRSSQQNKRKNFHPPPQPPPGGWQGWNNNNNPRNQYPPSYGQAYYGQPAMAMSGGSPGPWRPPPPPPPPAYSQGSRGSVRYA